MKATVLICCILFATALRASAEGRFSARVQAMEEHGRGAVSAAGGFWRQWGGCSGNCVRMNADAGRPSAVGSRSSASMSRQMPYHLLADIVVLLHAFFVLFVLLGGIGALRWPRLAWVHLPAALWGVVIELGGCICPLTYLENHLRRMGGASIYNVTFIEQYLEPILYPLGLTRPDQLLIGLSALFINLAVYTRLWSRRNGLSTRAH